METKRCSKCKEEFPATAEYFPPNRDRSDGLASQCRVCTRETARESRARMMQDPVRLERHRAQTRESDARKMQNPAKRERINAQARERTAARRADQETRERMNAQSRESKARAKADPAKHERVNAQSRESKARRMQNPTKRERINALKRVVEARRRADPGKREQMNAQSRRSVARRLADPVRREEFNALSRVVKVRRQARKRNLPDNFTQTDYENMMAYWGGCCAVCRREIGKDHPSLTLAADHWIALNDARLDNRGTVAGNMLPLCHGRGGCNNQKQDKDPVEWLMERYGEAEAEVILGRIEAYFAQVGNKQEITDQ